MTEIEMAAAAFDACCCKKKPKARRGPRASTFEKLAEQAFEIARVQDWSRFTSRHLVAQWARLHSHVYGIDPTPELEGKPGLAAASQARACVEKSFGGDYAQACEFLRWTWKRERSREEWRRKNGRGGGRMGWRLQFSAGLVNEYRLDIARRDTCAA